MKKALRKVEIFKI